MRTRTPIVMHELPMKAKSIFGICLAGSAFGHFAFLALTTLAAPVAPEAFEAVALAERSVAIAPMAPAAADDLSRTEPVLLTANFAVPTPEATVEPLAEPVAEPVAEPLAEARPEPAPVRPAPLVREPSVSQPTPALAAAEAAAPVRSSAPASAIADDDADAAPAAPSAPSDALASASSAASPASAVSPASSGAAGAAGAPASAGTPVARVEADAATRPSATVSLSGREAARYLSRVRSALGTPPAPEGADGATGIVEVLVVLDDRGRVLEVHVLNSSGHAVLDASAMAWLDDRRLPRPPRGIGAESVAITVPVAYLASR